ncbi:hypothetical protein PHLGIDRAFT_97406 [Phlebiopsis gigantea 11061_1 CR5-6]|uniref:Velvet domain-containing protein n=1 Tax=Phlebiopsis gigantea (strain 11061_1 CR5-6) TaxID=745531 RepID=A0A0C3SEI2_PHLG1|nr:hypothetical protein PHLGIDRAFT_97406 [Phlebiopsis gigantea 11061_1 CR5-6]
MIQKVNSHNTAEPPSPHIWGSWGPPSPYGRKYYSLEVVQHPIRARMCGFGDKDRRPLAPAAVAKMHVQREDHSLVDVDEVDCSFFLVTVDLWSADGAKEMNLVLHPTSSDRYVPPGSAKAKRRHTASSTAPATVQSTTDSQSPVPATPSTSQYPHVNASGTYPTVSPYGSAPESSAWGFSASTSLDRSSQQFGPPALPSIQTIGRTESQGSGTRASTDVGFEGTSPTHTGDNWQVTGGARDESDAYRWPQEPGSFSAIDSASSSGGVSATPPSTIPPLPRHTYTRTLVGPLSANACRLLDEHRKPGIFFLFQDLSIRTEGTFRLRLRLMNVGAPPAPEPGSNRVHTDVSPVLAQTFTEPFVVFSAKRFPGVPDTTALSIALGNQGQKLPLRNRNNTKQGRKRARNGSDESGEDSDDS